MAFAIATAHNIISSCCGDNNISNLFTKDEEDQAEVVAPTPTPAPVVKTKPAPVVVSKEFSDKEAKFEDIPWAKLPISARKAAKVIGFAEESWDGKEWLAIDDKHWEDLTPEECKACETLGWSKESWNTKYEGVYWQDLPTAVKRACEKLGWDETKWDEDWDVECWEKGWEEFSDEEKRALHVLGYYVHTWD